MLKRFRQIRPEFRYLLTGAGIGLLAFLLAAPFGILLLRRAGAGTAANPAAVPLPGGTPTPVFAGGLPLDSAAPARVRNEPPPAFPTIAPNVIAQMLAEGQLTFSGPLGEERQVQIYEASLRYIAPTSKVSLEVGERINGRGYGSPDLICGPLSLAILQDAGLVTYELIPYDFWLLNPFDASGRELIAQAFPAEGFERHANPARLDRVDWRNAPLYPGDFLYLRAGVGGNFEHMLVVNRVDSAGRAYAVTNFGTPDGFIIDEVMLYDPGDPKAGMFHTWTEKPNALLGATGFGGFELWRLKGP